ncbi:MAG: class I SAM-dependent RNA methyltransferase [Alphaproteobacteria bacterium]
MEADVRIEAVGALGDGIGRLGDRRILVPGAAPGDTVRVRVSVHQTGPLTGRLLALLRHGGARREPPCAHFDACGGCTAQHLDDAAYADWKRGLLATALGRQGIEAERVDPLLQVMPGSRRRARLACLGTARGALLGFAERGSRRLIDVASCPVLTPRLVGLLRPLRQLVSGLLQPGMRLGVELLDLNGVVDVGLIGGREPGPAAGAASAGFAHAQGVGRIGWRPSDHAEPVPLAELAVVEATFGGVRVRVPPGAFLQATEAGEAALRAFVLAEAEGRVAELFCGLGTFTLPLAVAGRRVDAWEGAAAATGALSAAARAAGLPVTVERRDLAKRPLAPADLSRADTVLLDPPRGGAREQMPAIAGSHAACVIYVSCNPVSFARDARTLVDAGFRLERLLPVDQFLWSPHLELAALFRR